MINVTKNIKILEKMNRKYLSLIPRSCACQTHHTVSSLPTILTKICQTQQQGEVGLNW